MFTKILQGIKNRNGILLLRTFRKHDIKEKNAYKKESGLALSQIALLLKFRVFCSLRTTAQN